LKALFWGALPRRTAKEEKGLSFFNEALYFFVKINYAVISLGNRPYGKG
jgi:hypothetical protein